MLRSVSILSSVAACAVSLCLGYRASADQMPPLPPNMVPAKGTVPTAAVPASAYPSAPYQAAGTPGATVPMMPAAPVPSAAPAAAVPPSTTAAPAPAGPTTSIVAQAAMNAAKVIAQNDPLLQKIESISSSDWQADPVDVYVNSPNGYGTISGATVPMPGSQPASLLQEYGCTHVFVKRFKRPQRTTQLAIYSFINPSGAYGAYSALRNGSSTVVVRGDASSEDDNGISIWEGRRFVVLTYSAEDDDVSKGMISRLADNTVKLISEHADPPALLSDLPYIDRVHGSEHFFLGTQAAKKHISLPNIQLLSIEKARGAASAEYQYGAPFPDRMRALVIDYGSVAAAQDAWRGYTSALAETHANKMVQPNTQLAKVSDSYVLTSLSGQKVRVIGGAHHKQTPMMLLRQLAY